MSRSIDLRRFVGSVTAAAAFTLATAAASFADEIEIGAKGPDFRGVGTDDKMYTLESFKEYDVVVLCFTCNDCPVARAYEKRFIDFVERYKGKKVAFVAINCNNRTENLDEMKKHAERNGFNFVYIFDGSGEAARAYGARVTPHLFALDDERVVRYRGSFDDSQSNPKTPLLENAVDALRDGKKPPVESSRAFGCGIKLKPAAETKRAKASEQS